MNKIIDIATKINEYGGRLFLVGGAVRDEILGIENIDEDYCVTGLTFEEFGKLFPKAHIRGKSFQVFSIDNMEFAIARKESKKGLGHKEFEIMTNKNITIQEDLQRRDITINAMAKDVLNGKLIDPFNGLNDLKNGIIRAVGEQFKEDPLRVYRVARFSSKFNFDVEKNTIEMMKQIKDELKYLSVERVYTEFKKALLSDYPERFFDVLKEAEVLDIHFEEIYKLIGTIQPEKYHPEGDGYNHTIVVLRRLAQNTKYMEESRKLEIRFSGLVHDIGKGETPKEEYPHHLQHETRGVDLVKRMGNRLKIPTRLIKCGKTACLEHMRGGIFDKMSSGKKVSFIERVNKSMLGLDGLQLIVDADNMNEFPSVQNQFANIGKDIIKNVNGDSIKIVNDAKNFSEILHSERVKYLKNLEKNMIEKRDLYDDYKKLTGKVINKGDKIPLGSYIIVVLVFIQNSEGKFLIQKRSQRKNGLYATTGGHPKSGEDSLQGIITEVKEEIGVDLNKEELVCYFSGKSEKEQVFWDDYFIKLDVEDISKLPLQKEEVESICWLSKEEILKLNDEGKFFKNHFEEFEILLKWMDKNNK